MKVSVVIIAKDAEKYIRPCLLSAKKISDDVVVVIDQASTDATEKMALTICTRVFHHPHIGIVEPMRTFAVSKTKHSWVLLLDADEEISNNLQKEILRTNPQSATKGFKIQRLNYILGKPMLHTNWEPSADKHVWLFKKCSATWAGDIHEEIIIKGKIEELQSLKIHHNYSSVEQFIEKMNTYTSLEVTAPNPLYDFLRRYVWHLGFLDGWHGLFLSYLMMIYHLTTWIKLWEKKNTS